MAYKAAYRKEIIKNYDLRKEIDRLRDIIKSLVSCGGEDGCYNQMLSLQLRKN